MENELKAADKLLGGTDGRERAKPPPKRDKLGNEVERSPAEVQIIWEDWWSLCEALRWLCSRPETWTTKFRAGLRELLPVKERLSLPGEAELVVFVTSDATKILIGAIDWTNGVS